MLLLWAVAFILVLQEQDLLGKKEFKSYGKEIGSIKAWTPTGIDLSLEESQQNEKFKEQELTSTGAAADPVSILPGSLGRGSWCNEHDMIHKRLDIIEETVIKTVEHLESEVKSLLNIINETTSNIPIVSGTPFIDIFDGQYLVGYNIPAELCEDRRQPNITVWLSQTVALLLI